ncbi:hypothetical protein SRHO_G00136140 [Serrasalmus rhombeus]
MLVLLDQICIPKSPKCNVWHWSISAQKDYFCSRKQPDQEGESLRKKILPQNEILYRVYSHLAGIVYQENSTQVYYIEVHIEAEAYKNFMDLISTLTLDVNESVNSSATVQNISITTECNMLTTGIVNCNCNSGYSWSEEVCRDYSQCCNQNECIFNDPNPRAMCLSNNKVFVNGSFTVLGEPFTHSLDDPGSQQYKEFVQTYTSQLESVYSTLGWFDSLMITGLRKGSVIADFVMLLTTPFEVAQFERITTQLEKNNSAGFNLIVTGITSIPQIQQPIPYNNDVCITCCKPEELSKPTWSFQKNAQPSQDITNGTEASVISNSQNSTVYISKTTEVWKGTFTCDYKSDQSDSIRYRASLYLDIALLPQILIISDPQFPSCIGQTNLDITVQCIITNTTENYSVNWIGGEPVNNKPDPLQNGLISYQTHVDNSCAESLEWVNVTCVFVNRLNQTANTTLHIPVIQKSSTVCKPRNGWPQAKANFTAVKFCDPTTVGLQKRNCTGYGLSGNWGNVISECVNRNLREILNDAMDLQRGLGIVVNNADNIFSRLKQSTEQKSINTFPNVNESVEVLYVMQNASKIQKSQWNDTVFPFQDFLSSSSNLLNGSLNDSWRPVGNVGNLALKYLRAVEGIIDQTNLITAPMTDVSQLQQDNEVAQSIVKTIVLLTPTVGITWILGLFVLMLDLTTTPYAQIVNYAFTFFNSFQGFFILLTGYFGEKKVRDALLKRFGQQHSVKSKRESSTGLTSPTNRT